MRRWVLGLLVWTATTAPAAAANRLCSGKAEAKNAVVDVSMEFAGKREVSRFASWRPADEAGSKLPPLQLIYAISGDKLADLQNARVVAIVQVDKPVKSNTAEITVRIDGSFWVRPWRMFSQLKNGQLKGGGGTKNLVSFFGDVPVASVGSPNEQGFNVDLLNSVTPASHIEVTARGDAGEVFASATYDHLDYAGRDELLHQAFTAAALAALSPTTCDKAQD